MMTREELYAMHTDKHEETNILKEQMAKAERYGETLIDDDMPPIINPTQHKQNRAYRRKLAAVTRRQQKINRKR